MFKKMLSGLLNIVILIVIIIVSILIIGRIVLSGSSLTKVIDSSLEVEGGLEEFIGDSEYSEELMEIIDEDKLFEELGFLLSDVLKYEVGVTNEKPDFDGMKNLILKYADEYEEETGVKISSEEIDELFEDIEMEFDDISEEVPQEVSLVFKVLYSNALLYGLIGAVAGCVLLDFVLRKDWSIVSRHSGIVLIINSLILFLLKLFLDTAAKDVSYDDGRVLIDVLLDSVNIVSIVSLVIGIVLIVLSIYLKNKVKNDNNMMNNQYGQVQYQ